MDDKLKAFYEIARLNSFTKAAEALLITPSALSHRLKKLESELEVALFIRDPAGLVLTEAGIKLFQYCRTQSQIEDDFLRSLTNPKEKQITGALRIGSVSSLAWSVLTPALAALVRKNPHIHLDILSREISELPQLFKRGQFDYLVTIEKLNEFSMEEHYLGTERYVLIESTKKDRRENVFLDHDENDRLTIDFFGLQGWNAERIIRSYMDDNQGLFSGVREGLGKAVVPRHLAREEEGIRISQRAKPLERSVYLYFFKRPFYSKLHTATVEALTTGAGRYLK